MNNNIRMDVTIFCFDLFCGFIIDVSDWREVSQEPQNLESLRFNLIWSYFIPSNQNKLSSHRRSIPDC